MVKVHLERMNRFTGICYDTFTVPDEKAYSKLAEMLRNFLRTRSDFSNKYLDGCDITYAIDFKTKYLRVVFLSNGEVIETLTLNVKDFRLPQQYCLEWTKLDIIQAHKIIDTFEDTLKHITYMHDCFVFGIDKDKMAALIKNL